jgi:hypothetical protein
VTNPASSQASRLSPEILAALPEWVDPEDAAEGTRSHLEASLATLDDLLAQLTASDVVAMGSRIAAVRLELTGEANIHRLAALYSKVAEL